MRKWERDWKTNKRLKDWKRRYYKREKREGYWNCRKKRNLHRKNKEEYRYYTNLHINKL